MKRALIIILTLAFIMSMAVIPVAAEAPQTGIVSGKVLSDFDKLTPMDDYADFADGTEIGADFVAGGYGSQYKIIAGAEAVSGNSFGLKKWTNIRWWGLAEAPADTLSVEFTINVKNLQERFSVSITEDNDPAKTTANEGEGGLIVNIVPSDTADTYNITDCKGNVVASMKGNEPHKIAIEFTEDSADYYFYIDGEKVSAEASQFVLPITKITAMRIDLKADNAETTAENQHVILDDIAIYGYSNISSSSDCTFEYNEEGLFLTDFDAVVPDSDFVSAPGIDTLYGPSFVYGTVKATSTDGENIADSNVSLYLKNLADIRWWQLFGLYPNDSLVFELDVNVKNITGEFTMCLTDYEAPEETSSESDGGKIASIVSSDEEGIFNIVNRAGHTLAQINANEDYKLSFVFTENSKEYHLFVNGEYAPDSVSVFACPITEITAIRLFMTSTEGMADSEIVIDNIAVDSCLLSGDQVATKEPTEAPTKEPTAAPTTAPTAAPTAEPAEDSGCGGVITGTAAMMVLMGIAVSLLRKKH